MIRAAVLALLLAPTLAGADGPQTLRVSPAAPTDPLEVRVELVKPNSCYHVQHVAAGFDGAELLVTYDLTDALSGVECLGEDLPEAFSVFSGPLPAGEHGIRVREFRWSGANLEGVLELWAPLAVAPAVGARERSWSAIKAVYR